MGDKKQSGKSDSYSIKGKIDDKCSSQSQTAAVVDKEQSDVKEKLDNENFYKQFEYISDCSDSEIDITNERFNPLKSLYSKTIILPSKKYKIYGNLSEYENAVLADIGKNKKSSTTTTKSGDKESQSSIINLNTAVLPQRRFLPEQGLVKGKGINERHKRNILLNMEKGYEGPTDFLKLCMNEKKRIKIYTRKQNGVLGTITGYIEVFDKHWNLVLSNCYEIWNRKKYSFCYTAKTIVDNDNSFSDAENSLSQLEEKLNKEICIQRLQQLNIQLPVVKTKSINRKYVECSRFISQLTIRGEQIIIITLDNVKQS